MVDSIKSGKSTANNGPVPGFSFLGSLPLCFCCSTVSAWIGRSVLSVAGACRRSLTLGRWGEAEPNAGFLCDGPVRGDRTASYAAATKQGQVNGFCSCLDGCLEILGGTECDLLAGLDFDGFAGCRVAAHARRPFADQQDAQARDANALALLQMLGDVLHQADEHRVDLRLLEVVALSQRHSEML